jgi:rare lipoprotein A
MTRILGLIVAVLFLTGCTELEFASHVAKTSMGTTSSGVPPQATTPSPTQQGAFKIGKPYQIEGTTYYPKESYDLVETGIASWYGPGFHGKKTASGERFDTGELTAAHRTLQMPSLVRVTNLDNGRSVIVRVNDRGPFARGRVIDVSERAASLLDFKMKGTAKVKLEVLPQESLRLAEIAKRGESTKGFELAANRGGTIPQAGSVSSAAYETTAIPSISSEPLTPIPGHESSDGRFMPDPIVTQMPVKPTSIYVQAGSFTLYDNAIRLTQTLSQIAATDIHQATINGTRFYRVRVGPIGNVAEADRVLNKVVNMGNGNAIIVVD